MSNTAIKVENLSKIYRLGEIGTGSIGQDVDRWFKTKVLGKEDPFLKLSEKNDRSKKGSSDIVYSLQDINFEIQQGDAVGIIGRNGAGKSTLLKILSRVTNPTTGKININGRVASLLEVGTGFHPELTGRENIYLNGTILGMRKREIDRKLDEIIDFSGVERYIDTPVKRYSSGMYVRLAFAVAAHLDSEILIVDEVLAVGDAEFQSKCLGKMGDVSKGDGRTVLFVSHNLAAVKRLCMKGIFLSHGKIQNTGDVKDVVAHYFDEVEHLSTMKIDASLREGNGRVRLSSFQMVGYPYVEVNQPTRFLFGLSVPFSKSRIIVSISFRSLDHQLLSYIVSDETIVQDTNPNQELTQNIELCIKNISLRPGRYSIRVILHDTDTSQANICDIIESALEIEIQNADFFGSGKVMRNHDSTPVLYSHFIYS